MSAGAPQDDGTGTSGGGLGRSAAVMAAGTATSRVLGVVRAAVLVGAIGLNSDPANAFAVANVLPTVLYMLIAGGVLNAVLVPQVVRAYRSPDGQAYVDRLLTIAGVVLLGLTLLLTLAAPVLVWIATDNRDAQFVALTTAFALWCLPQIFFYGVYTLLGQVLNARGSFGPYMWAPVVNNLVSITGMVVFIVTFGRFQPGGASAEADWWDGGRIALLGGTATLGIVLQAAVLMVPLYRSGFRYRPRRDWRGAGLGTAGRVAGWTFAALVAGQLGVLAVVRVASLAAQASDGAADVAGYAAYTAAFAVFMLPHSLVTVSLLTALFTRLSGHAAAGDTGAVREDFSYGLRTVGAFTVFATAALSVLALPLVRVVLPTAEPASAASLAPIVVALSVGLTALGAWSLCQRVYYAYQDARGLFRVQVAMACVVAVGTLLGYLLLPVQWWVAAGGASITLSYLLGAVWGGVQVRRRLGGSLQRVLRLYVRTTLAAGAAAAVGWPVSRAFGDLSRLGFVPAVLVTSLVGLLMLGIYLGLLRVMGVHEVSDLLGPLRARLGRSMSTQGARGTDLHQRLAGQAGDAARGGDLLDGVVMGRGSLLAGRYRLDQPLSTDLPGVESWSAHDQILDRPVRALLLREGRVRQAQDAARRAALVNDPRLLRVLDVGDHEGLPYAVTEPVIGRDLAELTADGPLPADQARAIIGEAAVALEVARRRGVHHLALRPSAVRITPDGRVVVSGLAMDGELAGHGLGDARSTTRADTVGLVALLYLALTGRWAAPAGTAGAQASSTPLAPVVQGAPVAPAELTPGVPNDLDTLCAVTLGPNDDGPHSPAELVRELEPWGQITVQEISGAAALAGAGAAAGTAVPADPEPTTVAGPAGDPREATGVADGSEGAPGASGPTTGTVQRQSVRASAAGQSAPASPPGTPPPAIPPTFRRADPRLTAAPPSASGAVPPGAPAQAGPRAQVSPVSAAAHPPRTVAMATVPAVGAAAAGVAGTGGAGAVRTGAGQAAGSPPPVLPADGPTGGGPTSGPGRAAPDRAGPGDPRLASRPAPRPRDEENFDSLIGRSSGGLTRRQFNPTPFVLALVAVAVLSGVFMAWNALTAPTPPIGGSDGFGDPADTAQVDPGDPAAGAPADPAAPAPQAPAPAPPAPPVIASAQMLDPPPEGDDNEHPEAVQAAVDGDPATFWYTRTYNSPTYGMKAGVGYAVTLAAPATVTTVTLNVNGTGGMVEVRATDPSTPTTGDVLASGPLGPETVLTLSAPTQTQYIVLWFTALPQTPDGKNRVELNELRLS